MQYHKLGGNQHVFHNKAFALSSLSDKMSRMRQSNYDKEIADELLQYDRTHGTQLATSPTAEGNKIGVAHLKAIMNDSSIKTLQDAESKVLLYPVAEDASLRWINSAR